jgi:pimeloyl-ACP methyl ester carboxylesterase
MIEARMLDVAGVPTRVWHAPGAGQPMVFVQGGVPGVTPWVNGAHVWGDGLAPIAGERPVWVIDLPGGGGTGLPAGELTVDLLGAHLGATLAALQVGPCHLVAHEIGALLALHLALDEPASFSALTVVSSSAAAPTGDGVRNLTLEHPPKPLWTRASQAWALRRIVYAHQPVDDAMLDACLAAAGTASHIEAARRMSAGEHDRAFAPSLLRAKARLFAALRDTGLTVPVQVVWGSHDPLTSVDQGLWLFRAIAARQPAAQFHLINRAGALPFREEPAAFAQVVRAFANGLAASAP